MLLFFFVQTLLGTVNLQIKNTCSPFPSSREPKSFFGVLGTWGKIFFGENHYLKRISFLWEKENAYLWSWRRFSLFQVLLPHSIQLGDLDHLYHHIVQ